MQKDYCEYCKHEMGECIFSIPMNKEYTKWSGMFCSQQCRINGNRYLIDEPYRTLDNHQLREQWILQLDDNILENKKNYKK